MSLRIEAVTGGVKIHVKVVPGSSRDRIVGELGDALKIAVSKPPQGGQANEAVIVVLANALRIPRKHVTILSGHSQARKQILILGSTAEQVISLVS